MKVALIILLVSWNAASVMASCPEDQEPSFCQSNANVPQAYCDAVDLEKKWLCKKISYGRCVCKGNLHRRKDDKCVPKNQCGDEPQVQTEATTHKPSEEYEIPDIVRMPRDYVVKTLQVAEKKAIGQDGIPNSFLDDMRNVYPTTSATAYVDLVRREMFVQRKQNIYGLLVTEKKLPYRFTHKCRCLKSVHINDTEHGALRTLECYHHAAKTTPVDPEKQGEVEFDVLDASHDVNIALTLDQRDHPKNAPNGWDLRAKFTVLEVTNHCLLAYYGSWRSRLSCVLWVFEHKTVETSCQRLMKTTCADNIEELWSENGTCTEPQTKERRTN